MFHIDQNSGGLMSFQSAIIPTLPYLRRYARIITGTQTLGDAAVREVLEALREMPHEFDLARSARVELYRVFHKFWRAETTASHSAEATARHALVLTAVEEFSLCQTAEILGVSRACSPASAWSPPFW